MAERCRICAGVVGLREPSWLIDELGGVRPDFIAGLCTHCILQSMNKIPSLPDYSAPARLLAEVDVIEHTVCHLSEAARRLASGRPAVRCEVLNNNDWTGGQCGRFAIRDVGGRMICGPHHRVVLKGEDVAFIESGDVAPRLIAVWARNEAEAVERARAEWNRKG